MSVTMAITPTSLFLEIRPSRDGAIRLILSNRGFFPMIPKLAPTAAAHQTFQPNQRYSRLKLSHTIYSIGWDSQPKYLRPAASVNGGVIMDRVAERRHPVA